MRPFKASPTKPYPTPSTWGTNQPIPPTSSPPTTGWNQTVLLREAQEARALVQQ